MSVGDAATGRRAWVAVALVVVGLLGLPSCTGTGAPAAQGPAAGDDRDAGGAGGGGGGGAPEVLADPTDRREREPRPLLELVSAGGVGRLYTLDQQEALTAVARFGMRLEPRQIGHLPRRAFDGSQPLYRLKPSASATAWLFTPSISERDSLVTRGWVSEGVVGHTYRDPGPGRIRVLRFSNGREWRLAPEAASGALQRAGYRVDGPIGYVYQTWIRAGAVYFGMFNASGHQTVIRRSQQEYGCTEECWWGGVRDFHEGHPNGTATWPGEDFSYLQPSIGYYDDSDPETLERHITQATSAGLSFFNFYWYWDAANQRERVTGASLDAFLAARNRNAIDFTVGVCAHPFDNLRIPRNQYGTVADLLVGEYLSQANTLRTGDGRRILNICDARGLGDGSIGQIAESVDTVRNRARQRLGENIYVMINQAGFDPRQVGPARADAAYCTTDGPGILTRSYARYLAGQRAYYAQAPGAYGRCVLSDFDERPRYPIEQPDPAAIRWMPDHTLDRFRQAVRNVRADIAASTRPPTVDDLVYVYAWNEWLEGGVIEPNVRDGCAYLDILRTELELRQGSGCIAAPPPGG